MSSRIDLPSLPLLLVLPLLATACAQGQPDAQASAATQQTAAVAAPVQDDVPQLDELPVVHVYKTPTCGCCADWVEHIEAAGFRTEVQDLPSLDAVKNRLGVPQNLGSCHTAMVGDYVVEGHVPASTMKRLLQEKPDIAGVAVPGMPMGSPGMEGPWKDPYNVVAYGRDGRQHVYESH